MKKTEKHWLSFEQLERSGSLDDVPFKMNFLKLYSSLQRQSASLDVSLSLSSTER